MILEQLQPNYAWAQEVAPDDPGIETAVVEYQSPDGHGTIKHPCFESSSDSAIFGGFREPGVEFSTVCPHPDGRPCKRKRSGRKGATGSLIRSLPGGPARDAARPGVSRRCPPSGPPTCAGRAAERSR